jgi:excinuclease ABC subunit A
MFEVCNLSIRDSTKFVADLRLSERDHLIADRVLKEVKARLQFLVDVGLDYLDPQPQRRHPGRRGGSTHPAGLSDRQRPGRASCTCWTSRPIGLHQRDNRKLIDTLVSLRDLGNTVIVVEHDEETIRTADHVVDIGPARASTGAGSWSPER